MTAENSGQSVPEAAALHELLTAHVEEFGPALDGETFHAARGGELGLTRLDKALLEAMRLCGFESLRAVWEADRGLPYPEEE